MKKVPDNDADPKPKGPKPKVMKARAGNKKKAAPTKKDFMTMSLKDWTETRMGTDPYLSPRENVADNRFWTKQQAIIYDVVIQNKSNEIVTQKHVDFEYIKEYDYQFGNLIEICESMGVKKIMEFKQPYNAEVVKQFYATVHFVNDRDKTIKWMSGEEMHTAPFSDFVSALHYEHQYEAGNSIACYGKGAPPSKSCLKWHYPKDSEHIGKMVGLKQRWHYLMKLLNVTISPKAGNFGEISGHVIQQIGRAHV